MLANLSELGVDTAQAGGEIKSQLRLGENKVSIKLKLTPGHYNHPYYFCPENIINIIMRIGWANVISVNNDWIEVCTMCTV